MFDYLTKTKDWRKPTAVCDRGDSRPKDKLFVNTKNTVEKGCLIGMSRGGEENEIMRK